MSNSFIFVPIFIIEEHAIKIYDMNKFWLYIKLQFKFLSRFYIKS